MKRTHGAALLTIAALVALAVLAPTASATPPDHVLERARAAVQIGQEKAKGLSAEAPGQENRARGLERAAQALAAAAERKAARGEAEHPGRGLGRGHAAEVHAMLLAGGSPSDLPPHSEQVQALAEAFKALQADRPGRGLGRDKPKDGDSGDA